ncbi:hypothetical protein [Halostagnicola sp. A56]
MYDTLLIPTDGSEESRAAIDHASRSPTDSRRRCRLSRSFRRDHTEP